MALGEVITAVHTHGFNVETIPLSANRSIEGQCWDVGGCDKIRPLYRHYFRNTDAFVWVVDSGDRDRVEESVDECVIVVKEILYQFGTSVPFLL
jgi:ADP-ribosylation factor 1/2